MPDSWKTTLAILLFCAPMVPVSGAENRHAEFHHTYRVAEITELLNRDSEWIHVGINALQPVESTSEIPLAPQRPSADTDATVSAKDVDIAVSVAELFPSLRSIRATGPSSAPPELPDEVDLQSLTQPDDLAGLYAEKTFARYYSTVGYGVRRAPRNTHCFYSHPLYYEDANLERCGRSKGCLTTAWSALHFTSRAAIIPYMLTLDHPDRCVATLPDCPTCHKFDCDATCPRWSLKAAIVQGVAVTGLIYVIP